MALGSHSPSSKLIWEFPKGSGAQGSGVLDFKLLFGIWVEGLGFGFWYLPYMGVSENKGYLIWGPYNQDPTI